jgi:hypothetical protein
MSSQLSVQRRWIAQLSDMMGVPPPSPTPVHGEELQTDDLFIPPSDVAPGIPPRSPSPPPPSSAGAPVGA